jgi:hypothetical protein
MKKLKFLSIVLFLYGSSGFAQQLSGCSRDIETIQSELVDVQTASQSIDQQRLFSGQVKAMALEGSLACLKAEGTDISNLQSELNSLAEIINKKIIPKSADDAVPVVLTAEDEAKKYAQDKIAQHTKEADSYRADIKKQDDEEKQKAIARAEALKKQQAQSAQIDSENKRLAHRKQSVAESAPAKPSYTAPATAAADKWENEKQLATDIKDRSVNLVKSTGSAVKYVFTDGASDAAAYVKKQYKETKSDGDTGKHVVGFVKDVVTGGESASALVDQSKIVATQVVKSAVNLPKETVNNIYGGAKTLADGQCQGKECAAAVFQYGKGLANVYGVANAARTVGATATRTTASMAAGAAKEVSKESVKGGITESLRPGK